MLDTEHILYCGQERAPCVALRGCLHEAWGGLGGQPQLELTRGQGLGRELVQVLESVGHMVRRVLAHLVTSQLLVPLANVVVQLVQVLERSAVAGTQVVRLALVRLDAAHCGNVCRLMHNNERVVLCALAEGNDTASVHVGACVTGQLGHGVRHAGRILQQGSGLGEQRVRVFGDHAVEERTQHMLGLDATITPTQLSTAFNPTNLDGAVFCLGSLDCTLDGCTVGAEVSLIHTEFVLGPLHKLSICGRLLGSVGCDVRSLVQVGLELQAVLAEARVSLAQVRGQLGFYPVRFHFLRWRNCVRTSRTYIKIIVSGIC